MRKWKPVPQPQAQSSWSVNLYQYHRTSLDPAFGYETSQLLKPAAGYDRLNEDMSFTFQGPGQEESCDRLIELLKEYDKKTCGKWTEEIDTLLVFAGLFSAVVTAFAVASFAWLQLKKPDDAVRVLLQISQQIQAINPGTTPNVTTIPPLEPDSPIDYVTARHVNALWFSSLSLALTAALLGILCKQWVRLYPLTNNLDSLKAFSIRQMRREGLASYGVPATIASISTFLEISVILFFIGLARFTWSLDRMVGFPVLVITSLVGIFLIATTITPFIQYIYVTLRRSFDPLPAQCPWKSPQSWLLIKAWNLGLRTIGAIIGYKIFQRRSDLNKRQEYPHPPLVESISSWSSFDHLWTSQNNQCDATVLAGPGASPYLSSGLPWALEKIESPEIPILAYHILAKAITGHDKHSLRIFNLTLPSPEVSNRAAATVSESGIGNAHLIKAVMDAKGEDFLHQYALEDERRVRINHTVPYCISAAFDEWATCSIHSSSCSGEFTQATLLYLAGVKGILGVEHCARVIGAHLGHKAKGKEFPPNPTNKRIRKHEYTIPSAVHVVFSAHMAAALVDQGVTLPSGPFPLDQMLFDVVKHLLEHGVVHVNSADEYKVSGRDFLSAHNIPRLPLHTLAYFPDIIRYYVARGTAVDASRTEVRSDVFDFFHRTLELLNDYVSKHLDLDASVIVAFQKLVGNELLDIVKEASTSAIRTPIALTMVFLIETLQERSSTSIPAEWKKVVRLIPDLKRDLVLELDSFLPRASQISVSESSTSHSSVAGNRTDLPAGSIRTGLIPHDRGSEHHTVHFARHSTSPYHPGQFPAGLIPTGSIPNSDDPPLVPLVSPYSPDQFPAGFIPTGSITNSDDYSGVHSDGTLLSDFYRRDQELHPSHHPIEEVEISLDYGGPNQDTVQPDGSRLSASDRPDEEEAVNLGSEPESGSVRGPRRDHRDHPIEEVETPGAGTEPSQLGSETGSVQEAKGTDKSEEDVVAHAASSNERTKLSDTTSNV